MTPLVTRLVIALAIVAAVPSFASAQTSRPADASEERDQPTTRPTPASITPAPEGPAALLAGPRVEPSALADADRRFETARRDRRGARDQVPPRRWLVLLRGLDLTNAKRGRVRDIVSQLDADRRGFDRKHGAELRELRRSARRRVDEARDAGDVGEDRPPAPPVEIRRRLQELQALAPKVEAYQQRIWDELTPDQQDEMRRALARVRAEMAARRDRAPRGRRRGDAARERDTDAPSGEDR